MDDEIAAHLRRTNDWRVAFGSDMDDLRRSLAELRDGQRDLLATMRAEREIADEDWRLLARHDAAIRRILRRYRGRGRRHRP
jgi:hypothetical protein